MAKRVIYYMQQCQDESDPLQLDMSVCQCSMFKWKGIHFACPQCMCGEYSEGLEAFVQARPETGPQNQHQTQEEPKTGPQNKPFSKEEEKKWMHKIHLLHGATGHGSYQQLRDTLEKKKVDPRILVDSYRCSICEERKRPAPRRVATLEVHPDRWKVVLTDGAHWVHPKTGVRNLIGLYMDQCSRFLVGKVLVQGKTDLPNADCYVKFFREHWQQYFGKPEILRFDAEGTWRSKALDEAFSQMGIILDPVPGDAHWHISPMERCIEWVKECLSKLVGHEASVTPQDALAGAIEAWNNREVVRGYSPRQHALGQAPDLAGTSSKARSMASPPDGPSGWRSGAGSSSPRRGRSYLCPAAGAAALQPGRTQSNVPFRSSHGGLSLLLALPAVWQEGWGYQNPNWARSWLRRAGQNLGPGDTAGSGQQDPSQQCGLAGAQ